MCNLDWLQSLDIQIKKPRNTDGLHIWPISVENVFERICPKVVEKLSRCTNVQKLTVSVPLEPKLLQPLFVAIDAMPRLSDFTLIGICYEPNDLASVSMHNRVCQHLTTLSIDFRRTDCRHFMPLDQFLSKFTQLSHLEDCTDTVDASQLFQHLPNLQTVEVNRSSRYTACHKITQIVSRLANGN